MLKQANLLTIAAYAFESEVFASVRDRSNGDLDGRSKRCEPSSNLFIRIKRQFECFKLTLDVVK